jgi:hypothetical protein
MAGLIWSIVGGMAMAGVVLLLVRVRQRRRRKWTTGRKPLKERRSNGSGEDRLTKGPTKIRTFFLSTRSGLPG